MEPAGTEFESLLETAHKLANAAAAVTLKHFRSNLTADHKGGASFDPVTVADREAEQIMRAILAQDHPSHGIAGEEFGLEGGGADYVWTLDPIDGTRAFILGVPVWGTLVGLQHNGVPLLGVMDQPFIGERFWNDEKASWYRGPSGLRRCRTRPCPELREAMLGATTPDMFEGGDELRFGNLAKAVRMRRFGGDCYFYCMLALGYLDLVVEAKLRPFDIVPLIPIVEKAGGVTGRWERDGVPELGRYIACGDAALMEPALSILKD
jgi:histidinol phosphatase-like enzyme (inositol monophosphatase family)